MANDFKIDWKLGPNYPTFTREEIQASAGLMDPFPDYQPLLSQDYVDELVIECITKVQSELRKTKSSLDHTSSSENWS